MSEHIESLRQIAARWRAVHPEHVGGVVLVWDGKPYGWKDALRDPGHERPGAWAVDAAGGVFVARGGSDNEGAHTWAAMTEKEAQE